MEFEKEIPPPFVPFTLLKMGGKAPKSSNIRNFHSGNPDQNRLYGSDTIPMEITTF